MRATKKKDRSHGIPDAPLLYISAADLPVVLTTNTYTDIDTDTARTALRSYFSGARGSRAVVQLQGRIVAWRGGAVHKTTGHPDPGPENLLSTPTQGGSRIYYSLDL